MNRAFHMLLLSGLLLLITGCNSKPKPAATQPTGQATLIGIIEMVNPEQNYVLIRCEPMPNIAPGTEMIALSSNGTKSKLVLTPEKKGYYVTADIKEGHPEIHHLVLVQRSQTDPLVAATPVVTPPVSPAPSGLPSSQMSQFQTMPSLPGFIPPTAGGATATPATPPAAAPPMPREAPKPQPEAPAKSGLGDLEPPVGGPS